VLHGHHRALTLCLALHALPASADSTGEGATTYQFDPRFFRGGAPSAALMAGLNQPQHLAPDTYDLDVSVNQHFVARMHITLVKHDDGQIVPCFQTQQWHTLGLTVPEEASAADCLILTRHVPGSHTEIHAESLKLQVRIPQLFLRKIPRGYVDPAHLNRGITAGFVSYLGNATYTRQRLQGVSQYQRSAWLAFNSGLNVGLWQLRQQSNVSYTRDAGTHWNIIHTYVQRPLLSMGSLLSLGQNTTEGQLFSGIQYTGLHLRTDERMLPDSQRGYAPIVRGVAQSNARVSITQNGAQIYQTTVPPGPFEITDLYPTNTSGDLEVEVTEADGTSHRSTFPFSAVPQSLRAGQWRSQLVLGRTRNLGQDSPFAESSVQRGVSNAMTVHGGVRLARRYQALLAGATYGSPWGTLGLDATWSHTQVLPRTTRSGWMLRASYSYHLQRTGTNVTLANYHYSTAGYQDLANVLGMRHAPNTTTWVSATHQQRSRFDIQVNQNLGALGQLFISGVTQSYRNHLARTTQYQVGYNTTYTNGFGVNVSLMRQHVKDAAGRANRDENLLMIMFSIPLEKSLGLHAPTLSGTVTHSASTGMQFQTAVSGIVDDTVSYSLNASHERRTNKSAWNGNMQKRFPNVTAGLGVAHSAHYQQWSFSAQGALAVHAGGITFGSHVGNTFGLIEAPGAVGASVLNHPGTQVDFRGYALVPALTPYRYNQVMLDPGNMPASVELLDGEQRVAPYAGAIVKLTFHTRQGQVFLIRTRTPDGLPVPFGAGVHDASGAVLGMVGQAGRIYMRSTTLHGQLTVRWGDKASEQCMVAYAADPAPNQTLIRLEGVCHPTSRLQE